MYCWCAATGERGKNYEKRRDDELLSAEMKGTRDERVRLGKDGNRDMMMMRD